MQKIISLPLINFNDPSQLRVCRVYNVHRKLEFLGMRYDAEKRMVYMDALVYYDTEAAYLYHFHFYPNDLMLREDQVPEKYIGSVVLSPRDAQSLSDSLSYPDQEEQLHTIYAFLMDTEINPIFEYYDTDTEVNTNTDVDTTPDNSGSDLNIGGLNDVKWN